MCANLTKAAVKSNETVHSGACVNSAYAIASHTVANASKVVLPGTPRYWLGCSSSEIVDHNRFAINSGQNFVVCVRQSNGSIFRWCCGRAGLRYAHHYSMLLLFPYPTVQVHLVEQGQHEIIYSIPVTFQELEADAISSRSYVTSSFVHSCL